MGQEQTIFRPAWLGAAARTAFAATLLFASYLVVRQAVAAWYFEQPLPHGARKAIAWDPRNAEYYAKLGSYYLQALEDYDPAEAARLLETATQLNPTRARYQAELGDAYEALGRVQDARHSYEQARRLFPHSPEINWRLGNFYVRAGRIPEALAALKQVVAWDPQRRGPAFELAWRGVGNGKQIREEMIPREVGVLVAYLHYLVGTGRMDEAELIWTELLTLAPPLQPRDLLPYFDGLIRHRRVEKLTPAWQAFQEKFPERRRRANGENLVQNGDFEDDLLGGGLDWRVLPVPGVDVRQDRGAFFDGTRSLRIAFDGKHNANFWHVFQYVPVQPRTRYRLTAYLRADGITTDSGPRLQVLDAYDGNRLQAATEALVGSAAWGPLHLEFTTGSETRLLLIHIVRPPSHRFDNLIRGTVWVDGVTLRLLKERRGWFGLTEVSPQAGPGAGRKRKSAQATRRRPGRSRESAN